MEPFSNVPVVGQWKTDGLYSDPMAWGSQNFDWIMERAAIGGFLHTIVIAWIAWFIYSYNDATANNHIPTMFGNSY